MLPVIYIIKNYALKSLFFCLMKYIFFVKQILLRPSMKLIIISFEMDGFLLNDFIL